MSRERSLYKILGIDQKSSFEEIKRAYLSKARQLHPDMQDLQDMQNKDAENSAISFSLISEAYHTLSNETLKSIYDTFGEEGLKCYKNSITLTEYKQETKATNPCPKRKRPPIIQTFECDLEDIFLKKTKRVKIKKKVIKEGKLISEEKVLSFTLSPELGNGSKITFENEGDQALGVIPSDIIFTIQLRNHSKFQVINNDLFMYYKLSSQEALSKQTTITIYTLDNRILSFIIQGPVQNGVEHLIKNEGMQSSSGKGNLIIRFIISITE